MAIRDELQLFVRRFGLLSASCCDECCGVQVSIVQSHILSEVRRAGAPAMQQVADTLGVDITTFSKQVKLLESRDLVSKSVSPDDRRVNLLGLTDNGRQVLGQIDRYMETRVEQIFSVMTPFERDVVTNSLALLNGAIARIDGELKKK
jgi:DNA-binding MarR family transcriptional regulator